MLHLNLVLAVFTSNIFENIVEKMIRASCVIVLFDISRILVNFGNFPHKFSSSGTTCSKLLIVLD
jgi:hypothetical protein